MPPGPGDAEGGTQSDVAPGRLHVRYHREATAGRQPTGQETCDRRQEEEEGPAYGRRQEERDGDGKRKGGRQKVEDEGGRWEAGSEMLEAGCAGSGRDEMDVAELMNIGRNEKNTEKRWDD